MSLIGPRPDPLDDMDIYTEHQKRKLEVEYTYKNICTDWILLIDDDAILDTEYLENMIEDIHVHKYGAHIFHTNNKKIWDYITKFATFNRFTNSPIANYKGEIYSMPFNMYTFNKMWGSVTPEEALLRIEEQKREIVDEPKNLEEQAISLVGRDIYEKLIKG